MQFRLNFTQVSPCHNDKVRIRVADGGDGLQTRRVATSILNKQSRTANKEWSSGLGVGRGAKSHHRNKTAYS